MPETNWRKSSRSGSSGTGNCVEVAVSTKTVGVRDSKNTGTTLTFPAAHWRVFLDDNR